MSTFAIRYSMYRPALSVELPILSLEFLDFNEHVYDFILVTIIFDPGLLC